MTKTALHKLYAEADLLDKRFRAIPREEVRAYWDGDASERERSRVGQGFAARRSVNERIAASPLYRDFEADLPGLFAERVKADAAGGMFAHEHTFAVRLYGSLCNVEWRHVNGTRYSCSWRYAGSIVSRLVGGADYLDFYCSGHEGEIDDDVADALAGLGWSGTAL